RVAAQDSEQLLHARVPGFDDALQIHREHAHVQGFHDVFAEILKASNFQRFLFKRAVKLGVIERNGNITCDGFHQLDIVARKEIPVNRFAKAENGDGVLANAAGNEIVQIQLFQSPADGV